MPKALHLTLRDSVSPVIDKYIAVCGGRRAVKVMPGSNKHCPMYIMFTKYGLQLHRCGELHGHLLPYDVHQLRLFCTLYFAKMIQLKMRIVYIAE